MLKMYFYFIVHVCRQALEGICARYNIVNQAGQKRSLFFCVYQGFSFLQFIKFFDDTKKSDSFLGAFLAFIILRLVILYSITVCTTTKYGSKNTRTDTFYQHYAAAILSASYLGVHISGFSPFLKSTARRVLLCNEHRRLCVLRLSYKDLILIPQLLAKRTREESNSYTVCPLPFSDGSGVLHPEKFRENTQIHDFVCFHGISNRPRDMRVE